MSDYLLVMVKAKLDSDDALTLMSAGETRSLLRALVARCEQAEAQNQRNLGLLEVIERQGVELEAEKRRHAETVEAAFRLGFEAGWDAEGTPVSFRRIYEDAWSEAKVRLR